MNGIEKAFKGRSRVLLPVVHCIDRDQACKAINTAIENGADGVFLINQGGMQAREVLVLAQDFEHQTFVGLNLLEYGRDAIGLLPGSNISVWSDSAGIDFDGGVASKEGFYTRLQDERAALRWKGLYFGGVAFKYQREVPIQRVGAEARIAALFGVDVVTTSGPATGQPPNVLKVQRMRSALNDHALAIASGITPENVESFLPYVDAYLVASGIESSFGTFDHGRVRALADTIHAYQSVIDSAREMEPRMGINTNGLLADLAANRR